MSKQTDFDKLALLGVEIDAISNTEAIDYICERAKPGKPACYVVKPYVEFLDRADRSQELRDLLDGAELALPDGVALTWAAAYLYAGKRSAWRFWLTLAQIIIAPAQLRWPLPDRTAGINFTWPLLAAAEQRGLRLFLVGDPKTAPIGHTAHTLTEAFPKLTIVGTHSGRDRSEKPGRVGEGWSEELTQAVANAKPDIVLVGMGFPLQERVCAYLAAHSSHGVFIGEGGTFDYERFGGRRPKAPGWVARIGLEWLWRLVLEPRRIGRQLAIPRFIYRIWRSR
jgi:N-acetylglucosaminyldiphosphoundecaprenol N-acetyl-beta-D-mannosaminyltransferase